MIVERVKGEGRSRRAVASGIAVVSLVAASCGDGGADTTTTEATPTTVVTSTTIAATTTTAGTVDTTTTAGIPDFEYSEDFESGVAGGEWSSEAIEVSPSGETFLGPFNNESVTLTLPLPAHSTVIVEFDLYIIGSWNGNDDPDLLTVELGDGTILLYTSFSNDDIEPEDPQAYPGTYPDDTHQAKTGSIASDSLEYGANLDSTYRLRFEFEHDAPTLVFMVTGGPGLSSNEVFGLDNVSVHLG